MRSAALLYVTGYVENAGSRLDSQAMEDGVFPFNATPKATPDAVSEIALGRNSLK